MEPIPTPQKNEANWRSLAQLIHHQASTIRDLTANTPFASQTAELAQNTRALADQIEHLADAAPAWTSHLTQPADQPPSPATLDEINREMIQIQRETHNAPTELMDIVKALFMWRDTPAERIRERRQQQEF
jgi:hypothetical protein